MATYITVTGGSEPALLERNRAEQATSRARRIEQERDAAIEAEATKTRAEQLAAGELTNRDTRDAPPASEDSAVAGTATRRPGAAFNRRNPVRGKPGANRKGGGPAVYISGDLSLGGGYFQVKTRGIVNKRVTPVNAWWDWDFEANSSPEYQLFFLAEAAPAPNNKNSLGLPDLTISSNYGLFPQAAYVFASSQLNQPFDTQGEWELGSAFTPGDYSLNKYSSAFKRGAIRKFTFEAYIKHNAATRPGDNNNYDSSRASVRLTFRSTDRIESYSITREAYRSASYNLAQEAFGLDSTYVPNIFEQKYRSDISYLGVGDDYEESAVDTATQLRVVSLSSGLPDPLLTLFNEWGHYALVVDGFSMRAYVNGQHVGTRAIEAGAIASSDTPVSVGIFVDLQAYLSSIDNRVSAIRFTPRALYRSNFTPRPYKDLAS